MDRLVAKFIESHPELQFTSNFPLQPFQDDAKTLSYDDPRRWSYTTIGDMAKDTRALGYMFALPASPDAYKPPTALERRKDIPELRGGRAITLPSHITKNAAATKRVVSANDTSAGGVESKRTVPYIVFSNVGCTAKSYRVDVYVKSSRALGPNPYRNRDFIGQITRIGMGPGRADGGLRNAGRCLKPRGTRVLKADQFADRIEKGKDAEETLSLVVTDLENGEVVGKDVYGKLPGFEPEIVWLRG